MIGASRLRCQIMLILVHGMILGISGNTESAVRVELLEKGIRVSIPGHENQITRAIFYVWKTRNTTMSPPFLYHAEGHKSKDGRWQHDFLNARLGAHDTLECNIDVIYNGNNFVLIGGKLDVCDLSGSYLINGCESETETTTKITHSFVVPTGKPSSCKQSSETEMLPAPSRPLCKGQLIFEENFDQLNETLWQHEVRGPIDSKDAEFVLYDGMGRVQDGHLIIEPKLWSTYRPDLNITSSRLDLSERCTGIQDRQKQCILAAGGPVIMPPVVVPRLSTKDAFQFKFGRIEIRAKMPKGDWIVPLLLLEPYMDYYGQTGYESGQLRVAMIRGNEQLRLPSGKLLDGRTLLAGPVLSIEASEREDYMVQMRRNEHFGNDFHVYGLEWSSVGFRFTIDGKEYGILLNHYADSELNPSWRRGGPMAPFDRMFYITLGLSVGGFGDFVDRLRTDSYEKPWLNKHPQAKLRFWQSQDDWFPSWKQPSLQVDYVRVYAV